MHSEQAYFFPFKFLIFSSMYLDEHIPHPVPSRSYTTDPAEDIETKPDSLGSNFSELYSEINHFGAPEV